MDDSADLIARLAAEAQGVTLPPQRTAEIAAEVKRLAAAIRTASAAASFDDEPAGYAALLATTARR